MGSFMSEHDIETMFQSLHRSKEPRVAPVKYQQLQPLEIQRKSTRDINYLADVDLTVDVELGSTHLSVREILDLDEETVVQLDCLAGDPVDIGLNGVIFAQGEVVVINDVFGVRVTELANEEVRAADKKE